MTKVLAGHVRETAIPRTSADSESPVREDLLTLGMVTPSARPITDYIPDAVEHCARSLFLLLFFRVRFTTTRGVEAESAESTS